MVNGSLTEYVRAQLARGYSPESIRSTLIQAGYNPYDVEFALRVSGKPERRFAITGRTMLVILAGILAIVLLVFAGIIFFAAEPKDIQLAIRIEKSVLQPGSTLSIATTFSSAQSQDVPVSLSYIVHDPATRKTVTTRSERLTVGASAFTTQSIPLPATLAPGEYEVKLTAQYEGVTRVQTARFTVQPIPAGPPEELKPVEEFPAPEELPCPPSCDDLNPATEDRCERGSCIHTILTGVCGNGACEQGENRINCPSDCGAAQDKEAVKQQALSLAASNPEKAATLCTSLVLPEDSDNCFTSIANASKKSALCTNIKDDRSRDSCLMDFALANDFSVCPQLSNRYLLTSCQSLARLSSASSEQAAAEAEAKAIAEEAAREEE